MSEMHVDLEPDDAPKNGEWVETCDVLTEATDAEIAAGGELGERINTDDDDDDGSNTVSRGSAGSDQDRAMSKAKVMKQILLDFGVPEVSIELRAGRPSSYGYWDAGFFVSDMSHHTVSRYGSNRTPVLSLCKYGRSDLPGPLCNGYGGWDLCYRIITFGYANHPGSGGSITLPALTAGSFTIPRDSARRYAWGTEFEGGLSSADWDRRLRNPRNGREMTFREFMGRVNAGLEKALQIHPAAHMEHKTWTSRKIDRLGYDRARGIEEKKHYARPNVTVKKPAIDVSNIHDEFRKYLGLEDGNLIRRPGVRYMQKEFGLAQTGLVNAKLVAAWEGFESKVGGTDRVKVPDMESMKKFGNKHGYTIVK